MGQRKKQYNGKVGIGDTTPDYGLDVVNDINSDDCFREAGVQVAGTCASDIRLKKNIKALNGSLGKITQLKPVEFEWKEGIEELGGTIRYVPGRQVGLVAQDVEKVLPHLVKEKNGYKSVEYNLEMQMMLINAIQELKAEKDAEIGKLKGENENLRADMVLLKAEVQKLKIQANGGQ
ncbi:tail fiber domain-containing protein [Candidatus Woesearchaeota archaeon]|nr:tail fiber domain-containing protein [Candidatus Woesearchaeota archaeon]